MHTLLSFVQMVSRSRRSNRTVQGGDPVASLEEVEVRGGHRL